MKILVTGGTGFLGGHLLFELDGHDVHCTNGNLIYERFNPEGFDCVIHLAAKCGGIGANQKRPGEFIYDNLMMGLNVIEGCRLAKVKRLILIGTVCSYPEITPTPFSEESLWNGYPEPTNAPYGIAKRTLFEVAKAYRAQYGLQTTCLIPANLYGPGDNFDPETSHVIPAMIRKFVEAKESGDRVVTLWGTGKATREFLYVKDCANAIGMAAQTSFDLEGPYNIGTGEKIGIYLLARKIAGIVGYEGSILWDSSKPDGQMSRNLYTGRAEYDFGFKAKVGLYDGLKETVKWYMENRG